MVLPTFSSTAPSVYITHPPTSLLKFTPDSNPQILSPPTFDWSLSHPFNIDAELYKSALNVAVPITIASLYATTVLYLNRVNKRRDYQPWKISKSLLFYFFVVAHNVFLAIYSGWTFLGMLNAFQNSWPGWDGEYGLAGAADALCKINGPRGLGSAATYNASASGWDYTDKAMKLLGGRPDSTDVGRIWNEGLAYYGWLFYLSKFYEVVDTAIILAKGKRSGGLQTFHHTGAMISMWAGIRYMSPPIWMFVFVNSGIHTLMYTYYTLSALTIQIPRSLKGLLTGLQIAQIVFGTSYALAHLFVAYDIPVKLPYLYVHNLSTALPSTVSTASSIVSSALSSASASAGLSNWLKKAALRAAGEEGLAENVRNSQGEPFGIDAVHAADVEKAQEEIRYKLGTQRVHCIDTSGEVFAILLNAIYLVPLFGLFVRFFYKSYIARARSDPPKPSQQENIKQSSQDAIKDLEQEIREAMANEQGGTTEPPPELKARLEKAKEDAKKESSELSDKVKDATGDLPAKAQRGVEQLSSKAKNAAGDLPDKIQDTTTNGIDKTKEVTGDIPAKAKKAGKDVKQNVQEDLQALQEKMKKMGVEGPKSKSKSKENLKPNGEPKSRDKSPEKKPTLQPTSSSSSSREKSPEKKASAPTPRDKSPQKKPQLPPSAPAPREQSPVKKSPPTPRDPSPQKQPSTAVPTESNKTEGGESETETKKENNETSPDLGASGYEVVPDEPKTEEEREAEKVMQPEGLE